MRILVYAQEPGPSLLSLLARTETVPSVLVLPPQIEALDLELVCNAYRPDMIVAGEDALATLCRLGLSDLCHKNCPTVLDGTLPDDDAVAVHGQRSGLRKRQQEVLTLVGKGLTNSEIAHVLHLSVRTVKGHVSSLLARYQVTNRTELVGSLHKHAIGDNE